MNNRNIITSDTRRNMPKDIEVLSFGERSDDYVARLGKYVPAEVITFYLGIYGIVSVLTSNEERPIYLWSILSVGLIGTYVFHKYKLDVKRNSQLLLSCFCFLAWAFGIGEVPFHLPIVVKALLAPCVTFFVSIYVPKDREVVVIGSGDSQPDPKSSS